MTKEEALKAALEALEDLIEAGAEDWSEQRPCVRIGREVATALREALAQPEEQQSCDKQEPVAWVEVKDTDYGPYDFHGKELLPVGKHGLYATPPQRQPLRGEQIYELFVKTLPKITLGMTYVPEWAIPITRAIEAAHNIGDKT